MVAAKRQQKLVLGLLCLCCSRTAADPASGQSLLRVVEGALPASVNGAPEAAAAEDGAAASWLSARESSGRSSGGRLLRDHAGAVGSGLLPAPAEPPVGLLAYQGVEVPDWTHGIHDRPQDKPKEGGAPAASQRPMLEFSGPMPPIGAWVPVSFSNYGKRHPMGPLLIACRVKPPNKATCEVLHDGSRSSRNVALYRAWSMWGDRSKGQAYVSLLSGSIAGGMLQGASEEQTLSCCENSDNAQGCVACTGLPSTSYNPLNLDPRKKQVEGTEGPEGDKSSPRPPYRYPISQSAEPVESQELFKILPNLKEQLGADADDLTLVESMVKTSHIQQLIPCQLTFVAVTDENARDFQGQKPPACLADALSRPENQRDMLKLVGRNAMLGRMDPLPISNKVPLLYGDPAKVDLWGNKPTWNNTELSGEKIVYDKGVIHFLSRNDMSDTESRELLRRIVYWSCLHDHLVHHPALTRFALIMVDNGRSLPVIGAPPGPRPDWVARGNSGWFNPPKAKSVGDGESEEEEHKASDEAEKRRPDEEARKPEDEAAKQNPVEADKPEEEREEKPREEEHKELGGGAKQKPEEEDERPEEADRRRPDEEAQKPKPEDAAAEQPKPEGQNPEAKQKPEEKEADRPKPDAEDKGRPQPDEDKEAAAKQQQEKEEAEKRRPMPEEAADKPKPDEEKEAAAKQQQGGEAERREPKPEEAADPKPGDEAAPRRPEEEAEKRMPKPEEKEAEARRQHEEAEKRSKPEEADKPEEGEAAPKQKPDEGRKDKPEGERKEDKPEEEAERKR
ncbi:hypothetical protein Efla_004267 [Eimeria flavescens]